MAKRAIEEILAERQSREPRPRIDPRDASVEERLAVIRGEAIYDEKGHTDDDND